MHRHTDPNGEVTCVTITRSEWRSRRQLRDRGRAYVFLSKRSAPVRAIVVPDGSPEAKPAKPDGQR